MISSRESAARRDANGTAEGGVNVLIVDDQEENLLAFETILQDLGQNIVRARSGEEALRLLLRDDYAVILLDVRMPVMDGFETATFIRSRARSRPVPIIFVTAFDDTIGQAAKGYSLGAVDYILKPVNADILRSKVKVFVDLALKTRTLEREVTERKRVEEELRAANSELEAFSYSVSHDLRGPVRAMNGYAEILSEQYAGRPLDEEGRTYLLRIAENAKQMNALIEDLLAFSRLSREKVELGPVPPEEALAEALSQVSFREGEVESDPTFPVVQGHRTLLVQVFANLISNAIKFVAPGVRPCVRIRGESNGERVRIWIQDNGIGIAPEHFDRIFQVFERLNPASLYPGTGVGLAIVRRAMERMGGRAGLDSSPDQGSRFWIELPAPGSRIRPTPSA